MTSKVSQNLFSLLKFKLPYSIISQSVAFYRSEISWKIKKKLFSTKNTTPITTRLATEEDHDILLDFLRSHFYPEEPLTIGGESKIQDPLDEIYTLASLRYNTSLLASRGNCCAEEIVGTVIAGPKYCDELDRLLEESAKHNIKSKWGGIVHLLVRIERETDVFNRFEVDRVLHIHALATHQGARRLGIGVRLMQEILALGKEHGYELITVDCSSYYSANLCERLGMECINTICYKDYVDECGNQLIKPPYPHESIQTFAKHFRT